MKIAHSPQSLRRSRSRRRGSTLIEVLLALLIGSLTITAMLWACGPFLVGEPAIQAALANQRVQVDEIALALRRDVPEMARCFAFTGTLQNADATPYAGTRLTFATPVHEMESAGDFLSATGLTLVPAGVADVQTLVIIGESQTPLVFMTRGSTARADGWTDISAETSANGVVRNCRFSAPPTTPAPQLAIARGRIDITPTAVSVYLPNPLALPAARLGQHNSGALVTFPVRHSRALP